MSERVYNFYSGPATLPLSVLERARADMLDLRGTGMSVMEISHRSEAFRDILDSARSRIRELLGLPADFHILFLQGGASLQFSMLPMSFLGGGSADYVINGAWGEKAFSMAGEFGMPRALRIDPGNGGRRAPSAGELQFSDEARYVHYVSNETIDGVEFPYDLDGGTTPVVCDASSNIMSRLIDVGRYDMIYAGAQKNLGPSGVTLVMIRENFLQRAVPDHGGVLSYKNFVANDSMPNTPNTWGIYLIDLVCEWLQQQGGLATMSAINARKAELLYGAIDGSDGFFRSGVERASRSRMNVTFDLADNSLLDRFCAEAKDAGLVGLKGHRSVGGLRASIYNAMPLDGVEKLVEFMQDFSSRSG